jgi:hypothetical protein
MIFAQRNGNDHGEIWIDDTFKEYSRNREMDIATGRLRLVTEWSGGGNQEPKLTLVICKVCSGSATIESGYSL